MLLSYLGFSESDANAEMQRSTMLETELDRAEVTIEFLRARLVSERSLSNVAKERTLELEEKVCQLEYRLEGEIVRRKKAELATKELLLTLQYQHPPPPAPTSPEKIQTLHYALHKEREGDKQSRRTSPEGCNCKLTTLFSFPRPGQKYRTSGGKIEKIGSVASTTPLRDFHVRVSPPSSYTTFDELGSRDSPFEISLKHGMADGLIRIEPRHKHVKHEQEVASERPCGKVNCEEEHQQEKQQQKIGKDDPVTSGDQNVKLESPRRTGKSCRTFKSRGGDISH